MSQVPEALLFSVSDGAQENERNLMDPSLDGRGVVPAEGGPQLLREARPSLDAPHPPQTCCRKSLTPPLPSSTTEGQSVPVAHAFGSHSAHLEF